MIRVRGRVQCHLIMTTCEYNTRVTARQSGCEVGVGGNGRFDIGIFKYGGAPTFFQNF